MHHDMLYVYSSSSQCQMFCCQKRVNSTTNNLLVLSLIQPSVVIQSICMELLIRYDLVCVESAIKS